MTIADGKPIAHRECQFVRRDMLSVGHSQERRRRLDHTRILPLLAIGADVFALWSATKPSTRERATNRKLAQRGDLDRVQSTDYDNMLKISGRKPESVTVTAANRQQSV